VLSGSSGDAVSGEPSGRKKEGESGPGGRRRGPGVEFSRRRRRP